MGQPLVSCGPCSLTSLHPPCGYLWIFHHLFFLPCIHDANVLFSYIMLHMSTRFNILEEIPKNLHNFRINLKVTSSTSCTPELYTSIHHQEVPYHTTGCHGKLVDWDLPSPLLRRVLGKNEPQIFTAATGRHGGGIPTGGRYTVLD